MDISLCKRILSGAVCFLPDAVIIFRFGSYIYLSYYIVKKHICKEKFHKFDEFIDIMDFLSEYY